MVKTLVELTNTDEPAIYLIRDWVSPNPSPRQATDLCGNETSRVRVARPLQMLLVP